MNRQIQSVFAAFAGALLALTSSHAIAQNRNQGQGQKQAQTQGQQRGPAQQQKQAQPQAAQQRQGERAMDQSREQDRSMDRERTHQPGADEAKGRSIYGGNLMTSEERNQYREQLRAMSTEQQRNEFLARHHEQMELRSRQRNVPLEVTTD
jgi:hypothetical protein